MQVQSRIHSVTNSDTQEAQRWSLAESLAFRFAFVYFGLYNFTALLGWVPYSNYVFNKIKDFWHMVVPWVGKHVLNLPHDITVFTNGSGDTTYDYVHVLCFAVLAMVSTLIWSLLDNKRPQYDRLHEWLRLYVRIVLASALIGYGISKPQQFSTPLLSTLLEPYGESSPMTLLWTFMGASKAYCIFAGFAEVLAGILLLIPNLTTLGALIGTAVMTNVFMLNMCYDVPVKIFSFHLLLMCIFLLTPEFKRMANFFLLNRTVAPASRTNLFRRNWMNRAVAILQILFCCYILAIPILRTSKQEPDTKPFIKQGLWVVDNFAINGLDRPPLFTDSDRWRQIIFESESMVSIHYANGKALNYGVKFDSTNKRLEISGRSEQTTSDGYGLGSNVKEYIIGYLTLLQPKPDNLVVDGTLAGKQIHATLHHFGEPHFLLLSRGFHWIQEYPFDR